MTKVSKIEVSNETKSRSLQDLSQEVLEEMEIDRRPNPSNYYREYGKAIAIVRINYEIPVDGIAGLKVEDVLDIETGYLYPTSISLNCYAKSLGLSLISFLVEVAANVDILKAMQSI